MPIIFQNNAKIVFLHPETIFVRHIFAALLTLPQFLGILSRAAAPADSIGTMSTTVKARPWAAAAYSMAINGFVWSFDRFVSQSEFSRINIKTIRSNIKTGFVWDSDRLATNYLGHPYNGGLYFTAARSCGLGFWQSVPVATAGSLIWEVFAEREPAGLNDLIATPLAGAAFGEVFHRTSMALTGGTSTGAERVGRELSAALINPAGFVNRLITGQLWKASRSNFHDSWQFPIHISLTLMDRYLSDYKDRLSGSHYPSIQLQIEYGDAFDLTQNKPYDYFRSDVTMYLGNGVRQPTFESVSISGRLWGCEADLSVKNAESAFGIWQQYDFYHNRSAKSGSQNPLFNLNETVAAGPGLMYRTNGRKTTYSGSLFADLIALGAVENPNIFIIERHYNMGSGFALKSFQVIDFCHRVSLSLQAKLFYLKTFGNYTGREKVEKGLLDPLYTNTQGDRGHSLAHILSSMVQVKVTESWGITIQATRAVRSSRYKSFPDNKAFVSELRLGVSYNM